jgi:hypothetical protein
MRLNYDERPLAVAGVRVPAHAHLVGHLAVPDVATCWPPVSERSASFNQRTSNQQKSAQITDAQTKDARFQTPGTTGLVANAIGMAQSPIVAGVKASGVPPRGRPV